MKPRILDTLGQFEALISGVYSRVARRLLMLHFRSSHEPIATMMKFALVASLFGSAAAFAPVSNVKVIIKCLFARCDTVV